MQGRLTIPMVSATELKCWSDVNGAMAEACSCFGFVLGFVSGSDVAHTTVYLREFSTGISTVTHGTCMLTCMLAQ